MRILVFLPRLVLFCLVMIFFCNSAGAWTMAPRPAPPREFPAADKAMSWLERRRAELGAVLDSGRGDPAFLREHLTALRAQSEYLAAKRGQADRKDGFIVYSPQITLDLFLLDRLEILYAKALIGAPLPSAASLFTLGGQRLTLTRPDKYPSTARVAKVLSELDIGTSALKGYRVLLLPYAMGGVSGQGGPGFAFIAAEPADRHLIPNQLEVTLVHEFGHYLHLAGMPRQTRRGLDYWREYLGIRGLTWREDGEVNTKAWAVSPEEHFAEDFRLLFGDEPARRAPAATVKGDPRRGKAASLALRRFMRDLAGHTSSPQTAPWPEEDPPIHAGGFYYQARILMILAISALGLAYATHNRKGASIRP